MNPLLIAGLAPTAAPMMPSIKPTSIQLPTKLLANATGNYVYDY